MTSLTKVFLCRGRYGGYLNFSFGDFRLLLSPFPFAVILHLSTICRTGLGLLSGGLPERTLSLDDAIVTRPTTI